VADVSKARVTHDDAGEIDTVSVKNACDVYAEMMDEDDLLILIGRGEGTQSRLEVWAERGRWPWSRPRIKVLFEEVY